MEEIQAFPREPQSPFPAMLLHAASRLDSLLSPDLISWSQLALPGTPLALFILALTLLPQGINDPLCPVSSALLQTFLKPTSNKQ